MCWLPICRCEFPTFCCCTLARYLRVKSGTHERLSVMSRGYAESVPGSVGTILCRSSYVLEKVRGRAETFVPTKGSSLGWFWLTHDCVSN